MAGSNEATATRVSSLGVLRAGLTLKKWPGVFDVMPKEAIVWLSPTREIVKAGVVTRIRWIEGPRPVETVIAVPQAVLAELPLLTELLEPPSDLSNLETHQVRFIEGPVLSNVDDAVAGTPFDLGFALADEWLEGRHPSDETKNFFKDCLYAVSAKDAPMFVEVYRLLESGAFDEEDEHRIASMCVAIAYFTLGDNI